MINKYELQARIYPIIIVLLPLLLVAIYYSLDYQNWYSAVGSLGLIALFGFLFSQLGRDLGKKKENSLWEEWGGTPTTQILRFRNSDIDSFTTKRIHSKLFEITGTGQLDMKEIENSNPQEADEIYSSWVRHLLKITRDTNEFRLLFLENISYGFRRNLLGLKPIGIIITVISMISVGIPISLKGHLLSPNISTIIYLAVLLLILIFWIFIVNKNWVKLIAFAYSKRLVEVVS